MDIDEAARVIAVALASDVDFTGAALDGAGMVTVRGLTKRAEAVSDEHQAAVERVASGLRMSASRLRPAGEDVVISRHQLADWFHGRDGLEDAAPRCARCLVPLDIHGTTDAWVCPSCGTVSIYSPSNLPSWLSPVTNRSTKSSNP